MESKGPVLNFQKNKKVVIKKMTHELDKNSIDKSNIIIYVQLVSE